MPAQDLRWFLPFGFVQADFLRRFVLALLLGSQLCWPGVVYSQRTRAARNSFTESFRHTVRKSGMIFDGMVTGVVRETGLRGAPLAYRISFQVKHAMRGVHAGSALTIREWAGLWTGSDTHEPRYRVGEHAVLFLYPAGPGGLTSPVGGSKGKLAVDRAGWVVLPGEWQTHDQSGEPLDGTRSVATRSRSNRVPLQILAEQIRLAEAD